MPTLTVLWQEHVKDAGHSDKVTGTAKYMYVCLLVSIINDYAKMVTSTYFWVAQLTAHNCNLNIITIYLCNYHIVYIISEPVF